MKLHEDVLSALSRALKRIGDLRLVRHTVYHPDDSVALSHINTLSFDDADPNILAEASAFEEMRTVEALGSLPDRWGRLYREVLAASFIHTVSFVRGVMGSLPRLTSADMWPPPRPRSKNTPPSLTARGRYPDHSRVEMAWLWLPGYPGYRESFEAHGTEGSALMRFPNPYLVEATASLEVLRGPTVTRHRGEGGSAFSRELRSFRRAITSDAHPADALGAARDTAFLQDMVAHLSAPAGLAVGGEAGARL